MKTLFWALLCLFLTACSTTKKEATPPLTYSEETMKTFEDIERQQVLEYYRQLRERDAKAAPAPVPPKPLQNFRTQKPPVKPSPRSKAIAANPEELEKEISQNLSFFCMRTRSQSRFSIEGSCEEFTEKVNTQCREQFEPNDRRLFNCVKDKLK